MIRTLRVDSSVGPLTLREEDGALTALLFGGAEAGEETPFLREAARQLEEYFAGSRREFDLPLRPAGTPFQRAVWLALREIPYGQTRAYRDIARAVNRPRACRAVGMANHVNPLPVFIPCHRVIGADGGLTGYAGGLAAKRFLLALEGALPDADG